MKNCLKSTLGKPQKKVFFFNGSAIKEGGGAKGLAIKEKITFFPTAKVFTVIKLDGLGVKALIELPLKKKKMWLPSLIVIFSDSEGED